MIEQLVGFCFSVIVLGATFWFLDGWLFKPYRGHAADIMPPVSVMPDVTTDDQLGDALGDGAQWEDNLNQRVKDLLYRAGCDARPVDWERFEVLMDCALREISPPDDMLGSGETIAMPRIHPIQPKPVKSERQQLEEFKSNVVSIFRVPENMMVFSDDEVIIPMTDQEKRQRWDLKAREIWVEEHAKPFILPDDTDTIAK